MTTPPAASARDHAELSARVAGGRRRRAIVQLQQGSALCRCCIALRRRLPPLRIRNTWSHRREAGRADAMRHLDSGRHRGDLALMLLPSVVDGPPTAPRADGDAAFLGTASAAPGLSAPQDDSSASPSWLLWAARSSIGEPVLRDAAHPRPTPAAPLRELQVPALRGMAPRAGDWLHPPEPSMRRRSPGALADLVRNKIRPADAPPL